MDDVDLGVSSLVLLAERAGLGALGSASTVLCNIWVSSSKIGMHVHPGHNGCKELIAKDSL